MATGPSGPPTPRSMPASLWPGEEIVGRGPRGTGTATPRGHPPLNFHLLLLLPLPCLVDLIYPLDPTPAPPLWPLTFPLPSALGVSVCLPSPPST